VLQLAFYIAETLPAKSHWRNVIRNYSTTIHCNIANADCICDVAQGLKRMSSSFQDFKIKAFRRSKDVESTTTIQEQEPPTPSEKKKIGAKAKKLAGRLVPAALGRLSHPDHCCVHKVMGCVHMTCCGV